MLLPLLHPLLPYLRLLWQLLLPLLPQPPLLPLHCLLLACPWPLLHRPCHQLLLCRWRPALWLCCSQQQGQLHQSWALCLVQPLQLPLLPAGP